MAKNQPTFHECKVCGLIVKHSWGLSDHMRRMHTNERPYRCDSCPKSFPKQYELKRHYIIHTGEKPYKCSICPESYRSRVSRNVHEDSHGILRHKCEFCEIVFFHREERFVHQKKAHRSISDSKFECRDCHKIFSTEKFLMLHIKKIKKKKKKKKHIGINIQCPTCQLTFTKLREFKIHERSHLDIKKKRGRGERTWTPHFCHVCNETFTIKADIIRHFSKFHPTADKGTLLNQKCIYCEKVFSSKAHLNQHLVSHSNERNFPCVKCSYKAKRQRDLDIHEIYVHSRKGLHQCPYCEKSFPVISMYRAHINKHENNRCFQCKLCEKAYYSIRTLRDHIKKHDKSNGKMEKELCPLCGKLLAATLMPKHLKNHEAEDKKIDKTTVNYKRIFSQDNLKKTKNSLQDVKQCYRYKCKKCAAHFKIRSEQFKHKETCIKKICTYCKMVFSDELECEVHVDSDHYDKLYQCSICKKKFRNNSYLISHTVSHKVRGCSDHYNYRNKQTVTGGYYFECFVCGLLCGSEDSLNMHIEHHKIWLCPDEPFKSKLFDILNWGHSTSEPDDAR